MKKIEYSKPEIDVTALKMERLLGNISDNLGNDYGGEDDGKHDPSAKGFWDDEEDY